MAAATDGPGVTAAAASAAIPIPAAAARGMARRDGLTRSPIPVLAIGHLVGHAVGRVADDDLGAWLNGFLEGSRIVLVRHLRVSGQKNSGCCIWKWGLSTALRAGRWAEYG